MSLHAVRVVLQAVCLLSVCLATPAVRAQAGGIELFAATNLFEQGWRTSLSHIYERKGHLYKGSNHTRDPDDRLFEEHRAVAGVDYGILPDLTASALFPMVYRESRDRGRANQRIRASGPGDVAMLLKYRAYKKDWDKSTFVIAVVSGLEMPTGDTSERENGVRLPPDVQVGSGAWNPVVALTSKVSLNRFRFDQLVFFKMNTRGAQDFDDSDVLVVEFDAKYRFLHMKYPGPTAGVKLGVQWRYETEASEDGHTLRDSGLHEIRLRPGISVHPAPNLDVSATVDVPVYRDYRGTQLGLDVRTFIALGIRF